MRGPGSNVRAIPHRYAREVPTTANAAVGSSTANADNDAKIEYPASDASQAEIWPRMLGANTGYGP